MIFKKAAEDGLVNYDTISEILGRDDVESTCETTESLKQYQVVTDTQHRTKRDKYKQYLTYLRYLILLCCEYYTGTQFF